MWTDFLTALAVVMAVAIYFLYIKFRHLAAQNKILISKLGRETILPEGMQLVPGSKIADLNGAYFAKVGLELERSELVEKLRAKTDELENVRTQSTALWQENVRLREVQLISSDRGMMTIVEEFIEARDEQNRQALAALGYQSMHKNDLDNAFGIQPIAPYITGQGLDKAPPSLPAAPIEAERSGAELLILEPRDVQKDYIDLLSGGESGAETTCLYCGHVRRLHIETGCKAEECQVLDGFECDGFVSE